VNAVKVMQRNKESDPSAGSARRNGFKLTEERFRLDRRKRVAFFFLQSGC